jgi:hypothetical protein
MRKLWEDPEVRKKRSDQGRRYWEEHPEKVKTLRESIAKYWKEHPETVEMQRLRLREHWRMRPDARAAARLRGLEHWKLGERRKESERRKRYWEEHPEERKALSEQGKRSWESPLFVERVRMSLRRYWSSSAALEGARVRGMRRYENPEERRKESERKKRYWEEHPEELEKARERMLCRWRDLAERVKLLDGLGRSPNGLECFFDELTPENVRFVGDGSWWKTLPNGKHRNPDFKVAGQNKVIELFGDYWHRSEDPLVLIEMFHRIGYECLVIWEHEIREDPRGVLEVVRRFCDAP